MVGRVRVLVPVGPNLNQRAATGQANGGHRVRDGAEACGVPPAAGAWVAGQAVMSAGAMRTWQ